MYDLTQMSSGGTIAVAKHIENRNTASEVLCGRLSVSSRHVQHSVQTMCFAREIQIGPRVRRVLGNTLKLTTTLF